MKTKPNKTKSKRKTKQKVDVVWAVQSEVALTKANHFAKTSGTSFTEIAWDVMTDPWTVSLWFNPTTLVYYGGLYK